MILCVGEILADMVGHEENGKLTINAFPGGAPFNVAVNAKLAGAKVGFLGRVGNDVLGKFISKKAEMANLDVLDIQIDKIRNTTIAFVTLNNGERDFSFSRHDTADFNIDVDNIDFDKYDGLSIISLGSLMLSESYGQKICKKIIDKAHKANIKISFDFNLRLDIFANKDEVFSAYKEVVENSDIIKFSNDELEFYTGHKDMITAIESIYRPNTLVVVTLGSEGSLYYYNGKYNIIPTKKVKPIDTTGAGDAFFGTFLALIENLEYSTKNIESALIKANKAGADTTQFYGAVQL